MSLPVGIIVGYIVIIGLAALWIARVVRKHGRSDMQSISAERNVEDLKSAPSRPEAHPPTMPRVRPVSQSTPRQASRPQTGSRRRASSSTESAVVDTSILNTVTTSGSYDDTTRYHTNHDAQSGGHHQTTYHDSGQSGGGDTGGYGGGGDSGGGGGF